MKNIEVELFKGAFDSKGTALGVLEAAVKLAGGRQVLEWVRDGVYAELKYNLLDESRKQDLFTFNHVLDSILRRQDL